MRTRTTHFKTHKPLAPGTVAVDLTIYLKPTGEVITDDGGIRTLHESAEDMVDWLACELEELR